MAFKFAAEVGDADTTGASASFLVQVFTNLSEYSDHGSPVQPEEPQSTGEAKDAGADGADAAGVVEEEGEDVLVSLSALSLVAERCISVRRTYSAFVQAREALVQRGLPGASELPELPGKSYFASSADARTLATRRAAFNALLQHVGRHEALACSDVMCAFLSDVIKPDYGVVHAQALERLREVLALPADAWQVRYEKNDIVISARPVEASSFYVIRSSVLVPLPMERTHQLYTDTANWKRWTPDATFADVERIDAHRAVLSCRYRIPVINDRDVCFYECALRPEDLAGLPEELSAPGCRTAVAMSVLHPLCPARRSIVRARLVIAVTMFAPTAAGDTLITSIQHADPRGSIPASVVNACLARGKVQLKEMRRVMVELG